MRTPTYVVSAMTASVTTTWPHGTTIVRGSSTRRQNVVEARHVVKKPIEMPVMKEVLTMQKAS